MQLQPPGAAHRGMYGSIVLGLIKAKRRAMACTYFLLKEMGKTAVLSISRSRVHDVGRMCEAM